jgi:hypothetical protein
VRRTTVAALLAILGLLALAPAAQAAGGRPGEIARVTYAIPKAPANGFTQVTFPFTVLDTADPKAPWFWADQVDFVGDKATSAYLALQPGAALFSVAGTSTTTKSKTCKGSRTGTACQQPFSWKAGTPYRFTIYLTSKSSTETWLGTITDTTTRRTTTIGSWTVPGARGLITPTFGFTSYVGTVASCAALPQMGVRYGPPTGSGFGNAMTGQVSKAAGSGSSGAGKLDCHASAHTTSSTSQAVVRAPGANAPAATAAPTLSAAPGATTAPSAAATTTAAPSSSAVPTEVVTTPPDQTSATPEPTDTPAPSASPQAEEKTSGAKAALPLAVGIVVLATMAGALLLRVRSRS